jgi:hypothetical protein
MLTSQKTPAVPVKSKPLSKMIGEVAVVAVIQASVLGMQRLDRDASEDSDKAHAAKIGTAKTVVNRLPGAEKAVAKIKSVQRRARELLRDRTTAWGPDRRLMPNVNLQEFLTEYGDLQKEHDTLVAQFGKDAALHINAAKGNLGKYKVTPPTVDEIKASFSMVFDIQPVPDVASYTTTTGGKAFEQQMREKFEADIGAAYEEATKDALRKLALPLRNVIERMAAYDEREKLKAKGETGGKEGTFKTTIIENIHDVAKVFRSFNLVGDKFLEQIATELEGFDHVDSEDLKKHKAIRQDVSQRAKEILKTLDGLM